MTSKPTTDELMKKIRDALVANFGLDPSKITAESRMQELGLDSMHVVAVLVDLETELGVRLPDLGFPPNPSLEQVAQAIDKSLASLD